MRTDNGTNTSNPVGDVVVKPVPPKPAGRASLVEDLTQAAKRVARRPAEDPGNEATSGLDVRVTLR